MSSSSSRTNGARAAARKKLRPVVESGTAACFRCGKPIAGQVVAGKWVGQAWHADHMQPAALGGSNGMDNFAPSHATCNMSEGGKRGSRLTNARFLSDRSTPRSPSVNFSFIDGSTISHLSDIRATPTILSAWPDGTDVAEAHDGARWLSLPLTPQGEQIAHVMQATRVGPLGEVPLHRFVVVEMARRSAKTTSILATLLGRALERPGYKIASTAQTGLKSRAKMLEVQAALIAAGFETQELGRCLRGAGDTRIDFANGSTWQALPPNGGAFRSEAYDCVLVDEAGEIDAENADELLSGLIPTMDTRPSAQLVIAGTPGETRAGLLWTALEWLRNGRPRTGGVVYECPDRRTFIDAETGAADYPLLVQTHPGIGTLTDVETVVGNIDVLGIDRWSREYLCAWPLTAGVCALDVAAWQACESFEGADRPANAALALDVDPDGNHAALVAAWRDDAGRACFDVLDSRPGYDWLPRAARKAQAEHRGAVAYDAIGANLDAVDKMGRPPHRVRTSPTKYRDQVGAAARFEKEVSRRKVQHYGDADLTAAVESSAWRPAGNGRLFLRRPGSCAVVAAALALWAYDQRAGSQKRRRIVTARSA